MIVDSMSNAEIAQELRAEYPLVLERTKYFIKEFGSVVKKTRMYPVTRFYEYTTPIRKNHFLINLGADKRGHWDRPMFSLNAYWEGTHGVSAASFLNAGDVSGTIGIYTSHCIARYRERALDDSGLTSLQVVKKLINSCPNSEMVHVNSDICHNVDNLEDDDTLKYASVCKEGVYFAETTSQGMELIYKTFLPFSMLSENQLEALQPQIDKVSSLGLENKFATRNVADVASDIEHLRKELGK